jgi:feruloyl esterase
MWNWSATHETEASYIPREKLAVLHNAVDKACDALDGVVDGVLEYPKLCKFDPEVLQCTGADNATCLTSAQVQAARRIYAGARNPFTFQQIFPPPMRGSEMTWFRTIDGQQPFGLSNDFFKYFVYKDPNWNYNSRPVNFHSDVELADRPENLVVNARDPNIQRFVDRGGKLLMWEGWNDTFIPPDIAIDYYESVVNTIGTGKARNSVRLFMVPNKEHCGWEGSFGSFDVGAELKRWRDTGIAPERIIISGTVDNGVQRTRPLCPYPQVATYTGSGSTDDARNFTCNTPK